LQGKKTWKLLGGKLSEREEVCQIAVKHKKTASQVLLKWAKQQNCVVIPKSTNINHLKENLEGIADQSWELDEDDMSLLAILSIKNNDDEMNEDTRLCWVRDPLKMLDFD
jgi:diketogulonate reductase-like aldo/keto reductase